MRKLRIVWAGAALMLLLSATDGAANPRDGEKYQRVDLGQLSYAADLNNFGQVLGRHRDGRLVIWHRARVHPVEIEVDPAELPYGEALEEVPDDSYWPVAFNERGQIVGNVSYHYEPDVPNVGFIWREGRVSLILPEDGYWRSVWMRDINLIGVATGVELAESDSVEGFVWRRGVRRNLEDLEDTHSYPSAINLRGDVVGTNYSQGALWPRTWADSVLLGDWSPSDVNVRRQIVGRSIESDHAIYWHRGKVRDLGLGAAHAINVKGHIAGCQEQQGDEPQAAIYEGGSWHALPVPGTAVRSCATRINDLGLVLGYVDYPGDSLYRTDRQYVVWRRGR